LSVVDDDGCDANRLSRCGETAAAGAAWLTLAGAAVDVAWPALVELVAALWGSAPRKLCGDSCANPIGCPIAEAPPSMCPNPDPIVLILRRCVG